MHCNNGCAAEEVLHCRTGVYCRRLRRGTTRCSSNGRTSRTAASSRWSAPPPHPPPPRDPLYGDAQTHARARRTVCTVALWHIGLVGVRTTDVTNVWLPQRTVAHHRALERSCRRCGAVRGLGVVRVRPLTHARHLGLARLERLPSADMNGAPQPAFLRVQYMLHCTACCIVTGTSAKSYR